MQPICSVLQAAPRIVKTHTDGTEEADMNPMISAELTRCRIADFHRAAQRAQLAQHARRMRRGQLETRSQTQSGRMASVPTRHPLAVLSARSPRTAR